MDPLQNAWLRAGYAVARTDYQALACPCEPPVPWSAFRPAAACFDIVSASRQLGLKIGNRYLIAGHSQGGHAALFAAGLASRATRRTSS